MPTLAELGLSVSASGVQQGLSEAQKQFKKFQEDTSSTAEIMRKGFELVKLALEAVAAVETVRHILEVTDAFRQMQQQLTAVTGSASAGRQALAWVDEFASKTPYSMQTVTKAFQDLWSVGINPMTGALQTLADANAAVGGTDESLQRLVQTIAMMKEQGIVNLRELQHTLQNEIPGAAEIMARQMGLSMGELDRMVKAGGLTSQQAIDALLSGLNQKFGGAALAQMHTFAGAWKELKDAADEFFRAIGEAGVTELAIQAIGAITDGLKLLTEHVGEARDGVIGFLTSVSEWIDRNQTLLRVILDIAAGIGVAILAVKAWTTAIAGFGMAVEIFKAVRTAAVAMWVAVTGPVGLITAAVVAIGAITAAFITNAGQIRELFTALWDWIKNGFLGLWSGVEAMASATWHNIQAVFTGGSMQNLFSAFGQAWTPFSVQMSSDLAKMAQTGIVQGALEGAKAVDRFVQQMIGDVSSGIGHVANTLATVHAGQPGAPTGLLPAGPGETAISPSAFSANAPWASFIQQLQNIFSGDAPFLKTLQQIFSDQGPVGQALSSLGGKALGGMGQVGSMIKDGLSAMTKDPSGMTAVVTVLVDILMQLKVFKVFSDDLNKLLAFFESAFDPLADIMTAIFNVLSEPMQVIVGIIKPVMQGIASIVTPVIQEVANLLAQILGALGIQVDPNSMTALANIAANPTVTLRLDTSAAMQSLQRAEDAMLGAANASQREIARQSYISARDAAVLAEQNQAGQQTGLQPASFTGFLADVSHILNQILPVLQGVWDFLSGFFTVAVNALTTTLSGIFGYLGLLPGQIGAMFSQLWAQISTIPTQIATALSSLPSQIATAFGDLFTQIAKDVLALVQPITDITSFLQNGIGADLQNIFNAVQPLADAINSVLNDLGGGGGGGGNGQYINVPGYGHLAVNAGGTFSQAGATPGPGGSAPVVVVLGPDGNQVGAGASSLKSDQAQSVLNALQWLQKRGYIAPGTVPA